ncbi:MAG: trigger factor [Candidatus Borkfalkiaceae bacterium]|nr:trigger factor [Christensenellaceae bacterium]
MNYRTKKGEKSTLKIYITLNKEEWEAAQDEAYNKTKGKYSLQGFRKGHVPKAILEKTYGKGVFYEDAINEAFPKYYYQILDKDKKILPVDRPDVEIDKLDDDGITMVAIVPVKPEVKLGDYKGINVEKVEYNVTDEQVQDELDKLQERNSRLVDVTDRAAENGDTTVIDYSGSVDGVKFAGGTAEKQNLVLGSGAFIPGFEEQIVGMNIGEEKDINVKFPEDYHAEDLKGKDAVFTVKLHEIKKKELPELNDDFIKDAVGLDSLEAYKIETREKLEKSAKAKAEAEIEDKLLKAISDASVVVIPDALVEREIDNIMQEIEYKLMYQGLKLADYIKYLGTTMEEFRKNYREQAETNAKYQLVIDKIIETEKITCTDEQLEEKIKELAEQSKKDVEEYKKTMNDRQRNYLRDSLIIKNLFTFLKENNNIG